MKLLFAGGGTAGHINPAVAIANYFCEHEENCSATFVGTAAGLEVSLVPNSGYHLDLIKVHGLERSLSLKNIRNICELPFAIGSAKKLIKKYKPDAVIGTGGYVCAPVLYAAAKMGIPTLIHESNAFPGVTTRLLTKYVHITALGVEEAEKFLANPKKVMVTGTPLRESLMSMPKEEARAKLNLDSRPFLVIFGGSLGARDFNKTVANWICDVAETGKYQIMMGTGKNNQYDDVMALFKERGIDPEKIEGITVSEYIYNMDVVMSAADLVISRAGASTLCELTALGKPSILVPSPYVTGNHQEHNARAVEKGGGAKVILEKDFTPDMLNETVTDIVSSSAQISKMAESARKLGKPDAIKTLYKEIKGIMK